MEQKQYYLSPDLVPRLAAVDIGSNSIRLIIAEGMRDGRYRVLDDEKESTRLGRNLEATGRLDPEAVESSLVALRQMKQIADGYQVQHLQTIATCAVREASDGPEFCRRVKDEVGLDVEVISANREAHLAFISVARSTNLEGKNVAVADVGGGSAEIVLASGNVIEQVYNTPLGAVRLSEMFDAGQSMTPEQFERMLRGTEAMLRKYVKKPPFYPHLLIGSGGTFTTLASMLMASRGQSGLPIAGYQVTRADVRHLLERLRKLSAKARRSTPGLSPDRADIIVGGLTVIDCLMRRLRVNVLQVHDGGVRDGLLLTMVEPRQNDPRATAQDRQEAIDKFALRCGVDLPHCKHVARLAGSIYRQLQGWFPLNPDDQELLEIAAQLQDVGYLINYEQHHKHSYHLILNSRLADLQPHELELIAIIARYHRGARPKRKHKQMRRLASGERRRVRRLAAVLRLAGGFDRSHSQQVRDVQISHNGETLIMKAAAEQLPEVDMWGAKRRSAIFERVFGMPVEIVWQEPRSSTTRANPQISQPIAEPAIKEEGSPEGPKRSGKSNGRRSRSDRPAARSS
jgi:exopolyphosphatase/guanosine-5'-triphosphate,3'-diphosphate pyrophosphatase